MSFLRRATDRILPALLAAGGVVLIASGLLTVAEPASAGDDVLLPTPLATASPTPSPGPSGSVGPSASPGPTPSPGAGVSVASRVVVPALKIDLPIVAQSYGPGHGSYPLCDVAQYLEIFSQPGQPGATYLYAHAREGMFLPLLLQSQRNNGQAMIGDLVQVYTHDGHVYLYEIYKVRRHATDFALAESVPPGEQRLILQTSEGGHGTIPKLQIAARLLNVGEVSLAEANPKPHPRDCR